MWLNRSQALGENLRLITLLNGHGIKPTPADLSLYPEISASLSTDQSCDYLRQMEVNTERHSWSVFRGQETGESSAWSGTSESHPSSWGPKTTVEAGPERLWNPETADDDDKEAVSALNREDAPVNSQALWQGAQDLHKLMIKFQLEGGGCHILPPAEGIFLRLEGRFDFAHANSFPNLPILALIRTCTVRGLDAGFVYGQRKTTGWGNAKTRWNSSSGSC